jgi:hypothetical protein
MHDRMRGAMFWLGRAEMFDIWKWLTNDAAGFFTFLLVLVALGQAFLFVWQLRYMRRSIEDARGLALTAQTSAETAMNQVAITKMGVIDLERAYLAVGPSQITTDFVSQPPPVKGYFGPSDPQEVTVKLYVHIPDALPQRSKKSTAKRQKFSHRGTFPFTKKTSP